MVMIPNPDKPSEAEEIIRKFQELWRYEQNGRWDVEALIKWVKNESDPICSAAQRIDEHFDELYPPTEVPYERTAN